MFDQLKDLYNLKRQAAEMDKQLSSERVEAASSDELVRIVINGKHDILEVQIADREHYDKKELAEGFKQAYSSAQSKLQKILMEKFKGLM
ncbi:MAG: YbaB/EbfC family nucleoid-associated protein [Candidatus Doudnabacteria bacterium]|nr:YbaB/EbfC family nucleoid-associated protein [Candidatus Doudnabacteria bacterium]